LYAVGAPRSSEINQESGSTSHLQGTVHILRFADRTSAGVSLIAMLHGEQLGSYFGASVLAVRTFSKIISEILCFSHDLILLTKAEHS